jgi:hypothetical protein
MAYTVVGLSATRFDGVKTIVAVPAALVVAVTALRLPELLVRK